MVGTIPLNSGISWWLMYRTGDESPDFWASSVLLLPVLGVTTKLRRHVQK